MQSLVFVVVVLCTVSATAVGPTLTRTHPTRTLSETIDSSLTQTPSNSPEASRSASFGSPTPSSSAGTITPATSESFSHSSSDSRTNEKSSSGSNTRSMGSSSANVSFSMSNSASSAASASSTPSSTKEKSFSAASPTVSMSSSPTRDDLSVSASDSPSDSPSKTSTNGVSSSWTFSPTRPSHSASTQQSGSRTASPTRSATNEQSTTATSSRSLSKSASPSLSGEESTTSTLSLSMSASETKASYTHVASPSPSQVLTPSASGSPSNTGDDSHTVNTASPTVSISSSHTAVSSSKELSLTPTKSRTRRLARVVSGSVVASDSKTPAPPSSTDTLTAESMSSEISSSSSWTVSPTLSDSPQGTSSNSIGTPSSSVTEQRSPSESVKPSPTPSFSRANFTKSVTPSLTRSRGTLSLSKTSSPGSHSPSPPHSASTSVTEGTSETRTLHRVSATVAQPPTPSASSSYSAETTASASSSMTRSTSATQSWSSSATLTTSFTGELTRSASVSNSASRDISLSAFTTTPSLSSSVSIQTPTVNRGSPSNTSSASPSEELSLSRSASDEPSLTLSQTLSYSAPKSKTVSTTMSLGSATRVPSNRSVSETGSENPSSTKTATPTSSRGTPSEQLSESASHTPSSSGTGSWSDTRSQSPELSASPSVTSSPSYSSSSSSSQQLSVTFYTPSPSAAQWSRTETFTTNLTFSRNHPGTNTQQVAATPTKPTSTPSLSGDQTLSDSAGTPTEMVSVTPTDTSMWTASPSDSSTQTLTLTETATRIRSFSRLPTVTFVSGTVSMSNPTITSEVTDARTMSSSIGSSTKSKESRSRSPPSPSRSGTVGSETAADSLTPSVSATSVPSPTDSKNSPSAEASKTSTWSSSPSTTVTPSQSRSMSVSFSDTVTQESSGSDSDSPTGDNPSLSSTDSKSRSRPSSSRSASRAETKSFFSRSPSETDSIALSRSFTVSPTPEVTFSASLSMSASITVSHSASATGDSNTEDATGTPSFSPTPSADQSGTDSHSEPPSETGSLSQTRSPQTPSSTVDGSRSQSPTDVATRSPFTASPSPSNSSTPSPDGRTLTPTPTEAKSTTMSMTPPPSTSRRLTRSTSADGTSSTITLRISGSPSASMSATATATLIMSESGAPSSSVSARQRSASLSSSDGDTITKTLFPTVSRSVIATHTLVITMSSTAGSPTMGSVTPRPNPKSSSLSLSADRSSTLMSRSFTVSITEIRSRSRTSSLTASQETPSGTQTLVLTEEVTKSITLALSDSVRLNASSSRLLSISLTRSLWVSETRTLTDNPNSFTTTDTVTHPNTATPYKGTFTDTVTEVVTSTTTVSPSLSARTFTASAFTPTLVSANVSTLTLVQTATPQETPDVSSTKSATETVSAEIASGTPSPSQSHTLTLSATPSTTAETTLTASVQETHRSYPLSATRPSASTSQSTTDMVSKTLTLRQTATETGTSDETLTESPSMTPSPHSPSSSESRSIIPTPTPTRSKSVLSFVSAKPSIVSPNVTVVRDQILVSLSNAPTSFSQTLDVVYIVLHTPSSNETATANACAAKVANASSNPSTRRFTFVSANMTLNATVTTLYYQGASSVVGRYDLCHYAAARSEWTWWDVKLQLEPKFRPATYLAPRGRITVDNALRLSIGVYGASAAQDHMVLLLRSSAFAAGMTSASPTCPIVAPFVPGASSAFSEHVIARLSAAVTATNATLSATGSVRTAGDYVLCYFGFPYLYYRVALPMVRIAGVPVSLTSASLGSVVTAFSTFRITVSGLGLSTLDPFLVANGTSCDSPRVPSYFVPRRVLSSSSPVASLTSVVSELRIDCPLDVATLCTKSNVSTYYQAMRRLSVLDNTAVAIRPNQTSSSTGLALEYARGARIEFRDPSPTTNGTLTQVAGYDTLMLCFGNHSTCVCALDDTVQKQYFTPEWSHVFQRTTWVLSAVVMQSSATLVEREVWSLCYATNSSRPWRVTPLQTLFVRRHINEPAQLPPTAVQSTASIVLRSFNVTMNSALVRVYDAGAATDGCPITTALFSSVVAMTTTASRASSLTTSVSEVLVQLTPKLVRPLELCVFDNATNVTFVSSVLHVVPTAPSTFFPARFVANVSKDVLFYPNDGSVFNFVTTSATVALCPNNVETQNIKMFVDAVINASALRVRFTNITRSAAAIAANALCFLDPRNGSFIPIDQGTNTFAVTAHMTNAAFAASTNVLRNVALVVPSSSALPTLSTSFVTISVHGISLYQGDLTLSSCSTNPSVYFSHIQTSQQTVQSYDVVTQVWRAYATVSGAVAVCASFGASSNVVVYEGNSTSGTPLQLVFDSVMLSAQQLPGIPQSTKIDHDNAYWLVAPTTNDSSSTFSAVRVVQYLPSLDDQCTNPIYADLILSSSSASAPTSSDAATPLVNAVWRFRSDTISFARGNVTLCYQSHSTKWYAYSSGTPQAFFMQAVVEKTSLLFSDVSSNSQREAFATCPTSVTFSGYQLDATRDAFYYYYATNANPTTTTEVCPSSGTPITISSVARDTTDINRLVNVSATVSAIRLGNIVLCARFGDTARSNPAVMPTIVGIIPVTNPLNVTMINRGASFSNNQTVLSLKCISASVLSAPSVVRFNYSIRFAGSTSFMPLDVALPTSTYTMRFTPQTSFIVRYTAILQSTGATLMSMDSDTFVNPARPPVATEQRIAFCTFFNSSNSGLTASSTPIASLATHVILMTNFVASDCGSLIVDGTLSKSRSAVSSAVAVEQLIEQDLSLVWDGSFLFPLISATYTTVLSAGLDTGSSGYTRAEATAAFSSLLSVTDPLQDIIRGANATEVVRSHLNLLNAISSFVSTSGGGDSAAALAPAIVQRLFVLGSISCSTTATGLSASFAVGNVALTTQRPLTNSIPATFTVGPSVDVVVPRSPTSQSTGGCVSAVSAPNFIPSGTLSVSNARHRDTLATSSSGGYLNSAFNMSTVIIFSDAPITNVAVTYRNTEYARVDALHAYRYFGPNRSSATLSTTAGGSWDALPSISAPYSFSLQARTLFINVSTSATSPAQYFVLSGTAEGIFPDEVLLKRQDGMKKVAESLYYILLVILLAHVTGFIGGAIYDRFTAAKRYRETSELLFGLPTPTPRWFHLHRYTMLFVQNPVSLTPKEYLQVRFANIKKGDPMPPIDGSSVALQELTVHPLALLSTPAKVNAAAMYCYCLLLVTSFVNRDDVAQQIPFLWDDSVLLAGTAAILARPFATWTRIAQTRLSQDTPSVVSATVSILVAIVAGGASNLSTEDIMISVVVFGVASYATVLMLLHWRGAGPAAAVVSAKEEQRLRKRAAARAARAQQRNKWNVRNFHWSKSWSLHHLIHVPLPVHIVGLVLLFAAWLLCIVLIFFVPYFANKYPVFEYHTSESTQTTTASFAFLGRGDPYAASSAEAYVPDTSIAWKTFVIAMALDAAFVEVLCAGALVGWMQSINWWRVGRFLGPTNGQKLARMGSMAVAPTDEKGTARHAHAPDDDLEEVGDNYQFVDVFSGSPVHDDAEDVDSRYNAVGTSAMSKGRAASTSKTTSPVYEKHSAPFATATPTPREKAKTLFYTNPTGSGLIEEVTEDEGAWDEDDMFASIDDYPWSAPPAAAAATRAQPAVAAGAASAARRAVGGELQSAGRSMRRQSSLGSMFEELGDSSFGVEVLSEPDSDEAGDRPSSAAAPRRQPPTSQRARDFRPPPTVVGPDAAAHPNSNPLGSHDAWQPPRTAPRIGRKSGRAPPRNFRIGNAQRAVDLHEDPWGVDEAASTHS